MIEFKKLDIKPEGSWIKRTFWSEHAKRSMIFIAFGAFIGLLYFYFTEGQHMEIISSGEILKSMAIGGFFGFFITNSPCARGKC
jgi:RsiW-degrading membrane proteinase PrsW (M82 family)